MPRKYTPSERIAAFWAKIDCSEIPFLCWNWNASLDNHGYGQVKWLKRMRKSHQIAYELAFGEYPKTLFVLHYCDNPKCCNPNHLFLGTQLENMRDMIEKGRRGDTGNPGLNNGRAKLNDKDILLIRSRGLSTDERLLLAQEFGVSYVTIERIVNRRAWKHIK